MGGIQPDVEATMMMFEDENVNQFQTMPTEDEVLDDGRPNHYGQVKARLAQITNDAINRHREQERKRSREQTIEAEMDWLNENPLFRGEAPSFGEPFGAFQERIYKRRRIDAATSSYRRTGKSKKSRNEGYQVMFYDLADNL